MARRRGRRRGPPNTSIVLAQIVGLGLILFMILFFRDQIAGGAGQFLDTMGSSEDVQVVAPPEGEASDEVAGEGSETPEAADAAPALGADETSDIE